MLVDEVLRTCLEKECRMSRTEIEKELANVSTPDPDIH